MNITIVEIVARSEFSFLMLYINTLRLYCEITGKICIERMNWSKPHTNSTTVPHDFQLSRSSGFFVCCPYVRGKQYIVDLSGDACRITK